MNPANPTLQDDWENNVYILSTTRVLMALGLTFLIRSVYQLFQMMRSPGGNAGAPGRAEEAAGIDLEALALGALGDAGDAPMSSSEPMDSINETLEVTLPQPTYSPQARTSPRNPRSVPPRQNSTAAS